MQRWLINGKLTASVSADDRGLHYGDGLFETIAVRDGVCRFLGEHLARLTEGLMRLGIPAPDPTLLRQEISACIGDVRDGTLKIIMTRGAGQRGYAPPTDPEPPRMLGFEAGETSRFQAAGIRVRYCATPVSRNTRLAGIKSLNRLEHVLARSELQDNEHYDEGLMLDDQGGVVCGTMTNLFLVTDKRLVTPVLNEAGVAGIMRAQVLRVANEAGIHVTETCVSSTDVTNAQGLFLTNALAGLWPIRELEAHMYDLNSEIIETVRAGLEHYGVQDCRL